MLLYGSIGKKLQSLFAQGQVYFSWIAKFWFQKDEGKLRGEVENTA